MDYLRWHKTRPRLRYDLALSGIPSLTENEFLADPASCRLVNTGPYGDPDFIDAISRRYRLPASGIVPVPGASSGNFIALAAAVGHGACILLERPVYEPIARVAAFLGLTVLPLVRSANNGFEIRMTDIEDGLRRGARAVVLTNLHNPSGQLLPAETVGNIAELCSRAKTPATLIVDEVYLDAPSILRNEPPWTAARLAENVIAVNSLTKVYGLSGLRAGWLLTNETMAERARTVMDLLSVVNAAPATGLAVRALTLDMPRLEERYRRMHGDAHAVFRTWLGSEALVEGYENFGGLFECVRVPDSVSVTRLTDHLASEYETLVVAGSFFELPHHFRLSLAVPPDDLREALSRISRAIHDLQG